MGEYLCIGLTAEIIIAKEEVFNKAVDKSEIESVLGNIIDLSIYLFSETEKNFCWKLNPDILIIDIANVLTLLFKYYGGSNEEYYQDVINDIRSQQNSEKLINLALKGFHEHFKWHDGRDENYIYAGKKKRKITIDYKQIILFMEGKLSIETDYQMFRFFDKIIRENLRHYRLAGAIQVFVCSPH